MLRSPKALIMIVVDDIDNIPPKNRQFMAENCSSLPVTKPTLIMPSTMISVVTMAEPPTFISFLKLNSSPNENSNTIMPI